MAPNNYYQSYPANTQNSSNPQQTYPGYHAQTSMSNQPSGQYHTTGPPSPPSAPPTHDTYQGYQQQYAHQGTGYGSNQGFSWNATYGANSGNSTAGSAAEALSSMSMADHSRAANAGYASGYNTSSGMSDRNIAALSQYTQGSSAAPQDHQTHTIQDTSRSSGTSHTAHAHRTSRPESVSSISSGYAAPTQRPAPLRLPTPGAPSAATSQHPARRVQAMSTEHRSPSPAQVRASHNAQSGAAQRPAGSSLAAQYADLGSRRLPSVSETAYGNSSTATHRQSYDRQTQNYEPSSVTVDPAHVYDPWQEKMRQAELARKAKEAEEAAAAVRAAEDAERQKKAEETRKAAEDARKAEEHRRTEAARKAEEERRASDTTQAQPGQKAKAKKDSAKGKRATDPRVPSRKEAGPAATTATPAPAAPAAAPTAEDLEAQMRMIMANLREMNAKNPSLVAKIWEEERASLVQESTRSPATQAAQPPSASAPQVAPRANMAAVRPGSVQNGMVNGHASGGRSITGPGYPPQQPRQEQYAPPQPVPAKPSSGGTVWPQEKKGELAAAAAKWLNDIPANANNKVSPADIFRMLDSNPTYIDLCERLEGLGVLLERRTFAQALLKACPDVNNKSQIQKPPMPPGQTAQPLHGLPTPHPTDDDMGPAPVDDPIYDAPPAPDPDAVQSPYFQQPPASATPGAVAPIATMISSTKRAQAMRTPPIKAATKADAARKRYFSEIIDLTTFSDEELPPPPPKVPRTDPHGMLAFQPPPTAQQTTFINPNLRQLNVPPNGVPLQPHAAPQLVHPPAPVYDEFYKYTDLVKPIDRKKALRRSTYNLNTIARDVLLATGKHPEMRALNAHLEPLKLAFRQVEDRSDLDTFRWDIVDPGDPPPGYYSSGGAEAEEDADDEEDEPQPRARPRVMLQAGVGVGGGAATSRVADYNHDPAVAKAFFKKSRGRPPRHRDPGFVSRPPGPNTTDPAHRQRSYSQGGNNSSSGLGHPSLSNIGRDPHVTPAGRLPSASAGAPPSQGTGVGYSALRVQEYGPDGSPLPKKRGRPVGWRKSIHGSAAAQSGTIRPGQGSGLRNVARPGAGGASGAVVEIRSSNSPAMRQEVEYRVYKCRWQGCKAELHNLDTLRKHVFKLHGRPAAGGRWKCQWEGCGETGTVMDEATGEESDEHRYLEFTDGEKWRGHIEAAHLGELAWELGDGPAGGLSESHDSDAYLSDRSGRRATPQIAAPSGASSSAPASAAHRAGPGRPAKKSDEQKALEAQRRLEQVKRDIGPGVDRGGARLANEKRRAGFVDDEVGEEIVDED
ncbi:hypothetical protein W97_00385 [Coniosporium apollinis CBS 100218]|uniref:C2H2-type domain-containing protein n=1 Tax=Coniosporium apollinis (strain CBS 100218) TaxID=1168221 RepID=R7YH14_CONA1|nr:uncharacterized protein W97_00385 [Coniosporium apollinis CBS 100218]EON61173.1 hypothetical protein W97_00385 [Coniosporium apollinis CBS 100218]